MTVTVELSMPCRDWQRCLPDAGVRAERAVRAALREGAAALHLALPSCEISVVLGDDALIRQLNRERRGRDRATDVLSFPTFDPAALKRAAAAAADTAPVPLLLGDVVLALETVAAAATEGDLALGDHFAHLVVHGVLHLLGHDHQEPAAARAMEALESRALAALGIADPWADPGTEAGAGMAAGLRS